MFLSLLTLYHIWSSFSFLFVTHQLYHNTVYVRELSNEWTHLTNVYYGDYAESVEFSAGFDVPISFDAIAFSRNSSETSNHDYDFKIMEHSTYSKEISEIQSYQVIQSPLWFNDHYIWPNRPENIIYNCIGLSIDIDTEQFLDETEEVVVCVKPEGENWRVLQYEKVEVTSKNYEFKVMFETPLNLEEFCCYPNTKNAYKVSSGVQIPLNLGNAKDFYCISYY